MRTFFLPAVVVLSACSSGGAGSPSFGDDSGALADSTSFDGSTPVDGMATDTGRNGDSTSASDTTPADAGKPIPYCTQTCSSPADCATASAAFGAANYACNSGVCAYTGCKSDAECQSSFANPAYACRTGKGGTFPTCLHTCTKPADCATASAAYDADNYACDAGTCTYLGCNTDAECKSAFASTAYVCATIPVPGIDPLPTATKNCVKSCSVPADCATASAAYDADNYACQGGLCAYKGCNDAAECQASFAKSNFTCR